MKKALIVLMLILCAAISASANQLGFGYNNGGPTVRFKWEDAVTSELSVLLDYSNDAASSSSSTDITLSLAPINLALYRGDLGEVSLGFVFRDMIIYQVGRGANKNVLFTANTYSFDILLPELELNFPGVKDLKLISSLGIGTSWGYSPNGKLDSFHMDLFGISLANIGLVYYFDLGSPPKPAVTPVVVPAVKPAAVVPANGAAVKPAAAAKTTTAVEPAKETPVK